MLFILCCILCTVLFIMYYLIASRIPPGRVVRTNWAVRCRGWSKRKEQNSRPKVTTFYHTNIKNVTKMGAQWDNKRIFFEKRAQKRKRRPPKRSGPERVTFFSRFFWKMCPPGAPKGSPHRDNIEKHHVRNRCFGRWAPGNAFSSIFNDKWLKQRMKNISFF